MSVFVENVLNLISKHNLTLRALSEKVGISSSQLSKYVSGNYEPSLKNALLLSSFFNCSLDYLYGLDNIPNRNTIILKENSNKFCERLSYLIEQNHTNINRISKHTYLNRNSIYYWLEKKVFPKVGIIAKLATELDTTIEYLIGRTDNMRRGL